MSPSTETQIETTYRLATDFSGRPPPPKGGYSWEQIKTAVDSNSLHVLRRTDKGQFEYEQWQAGIDRIKYKNAGEYIAFQILKWPSLTDPAEQAIAGTERALSEQHQAIDPRLTLRLNHFPFPVEESIQYFVLWSTRDMSTPEEHDRLDRYLKAKLTWQGNESELQSPELLAPGPGKHKEWFYFVNPPELRSIATVHHIHVFVRDVK